MSFREPFYVKVGDRLPILRVQLVNPDGTPQNLTGLFPVINVSNAATGVAKVVNGAMTVEAGTSGWATYEWAAINTDTPGFYNMEYRVAISGRDITYPADGYDRMIIQGRL